MVSTRHGSTGGGRTHEKIIGVRVGTANLEQLHQVMELSVDVTTDCDGTFLHISERLYSIKGHNTYHRLYV